MAAYPTSAATDTNLYVAVNNISTTLVDNPCDSSQTTINVASTTGFPASGYITIEAEAIKYTAKTSTSFTGCTRGADGTTAVGHPYPVQVLLTVVADHHNALKEEVKAIETDLVNVQSAISPVTATSTATNVLNRFAMLCSQIKNIGGLTNWYDAVTAMLPLSGGTMTGNMVMSQTTASAPIVSVIKANSTVANESGGQLIFSNRGPAATSRNTGVIAGQLVFNFSQPTSGADQGSASIVASAQQTQSGTETPTKLAFTCYTNATGTQTCLTLANGGIVGVTTNSNATAGNIGEYISSSVLRASAITNTTTSTWYNLTSISLTAGDWDVSAMGATFGGTGFTDFQLYSGSSSTSADLVYGVNLAETTSAPNGNGDSGLSIPVMRLSLNSTTTIYLNSLTQFTGGTSKTYGTIHARRVR